MARKRSTTPTATRRPRRRRASADYDAYRVDGPIETDWTVSTEYRANGRILTPGTEVSIRGERGRFRFLKHVSRPNGIEWLDFWGGPKGAESWRSFRPDRIRRVHRIGRTDKAILAARKAAKEAAA